MRFATGINKFFAISALFLLFAQFSTAEAQELAQPQKPPPPPTGPPIFSHYIGYAGMTEYEGEMIPWFVISDVYIFNELHFKNARQEKKYYKIAYNIKKVYPIALEIQRVLKKCLAHMDSLPTKAEKDAYMKTVEKQLKAVYTPRMKKLTFAQGKLLIKLVDRQCKSTSYDIIRTYMGKFKAGFWNAFASIFGASLKKEYDAEGDDRLTERCILLIESGQM